MTDALLSAVGLTKRFNAPSGLFGPKRQVHAVEDVSFTIRKGEVLGLVGESGSGKTTVGRMVMGLIPPTAGAIVFDGQDIAGLNRAAMLPYRQRIQMVFQDPFASLNPRRKVGDLIAEGMEIHRIGTRAEQRAEVARLLDIVGLPADAADRFPHEFSGGQRQRIGIARALAVKPDMLVADEPVSALDVSVQAQVLNLLRDLQDEFGLAYVFISHDLGVVRFMADEVLVMKDGAVVEQAATRELLAAPRQDYTRRLLAAVPRMDAWRPAASHL